MRHKHKIEEGFTLVELIVVIVIIMIIATAVAPNLDNLSPKYSVRAGAREIASTIESCRSQSVLTGKTYSMVYDLDEQEYWLLLPEKLDPYGEPLEDERQIVLPKRKLPTDVEFVEIITPDNDSHNGGIIQFDYSPFGHTGSHIAVIRHGEDDESRIWIRTNALLGFTTFHYVELGFVEYDEEEDDEFYGENSQTP